MIMPAHRPRGPQPRVLILESDAAFALTLRQNLELEGYEVELTNAGPHGLLLARGLRPDLIVLGLMLHELEGCRLLGELRLEHPNVPVLIVSPHVEEPQRLSGFRLGADEFVVRPASVAELHMRIDWLLRRRIPAFDAPLPPALEGSLSFGGIEIRPASRTVLREGSEVDLRPKEYDLLIALARRNGRLVSRGELLRDVWGYTDSVTSRTVDSHMARLRQRLESDPRRPRHLLTIRKAGYRLVR